MQRIGAGHDDAYSSGERASRVDEQLATRSTSAALYEEAGDVTGAGSLSVARKARCESVLPVQAGEGTHLLAGVEVNFFAIEDEDGKIVVQLLRGEIARVEDGAVPVDDLSGEDFQPSGTGQRDVKQRDVVRRTTLLLPDIVGIANFLIFSRFSSASDFLREKFVFSSFWTAA